MNAGQRSLLNLARLAVTLGAVAWVLVKIDWADQLRLADGTVLRGRVVTLEDRYVLETRAGGPALELPRATPAGANAYQPGFLRLFRDIRPLYLAMGLAVYPLAIVLGAVRWRELMRAHQMDPGFGPSLRLTWIGFFWSLIFPGVTGGDLVKAYCVARTAEKRAVSVLTVFLDRVIGIIGLAVLSGTVILLNIHNPELRAVRTGLLVFSTAIAASGLLFFSRRLRRRLGLDWLRDRLPFQAQVSQLDSALFEYRYHMKTVLGALGLSLAAHVLNVGTFWFAGASLGLPVAWQHYFVFIPVILMIAALPISVGGLGVFEGGMVHFLTLRAVGATVGGAFALCVLYRIMTILVGLPGALMGTDSRRQAGVLPRG